MCGRNEVIHTITVVSFLKFNAKFEAVAEYCEMHMYPQTDALAAAEPPCTIHI